MKNSQRKKIKMLTSYQEGFYNPPYPYSLKVRGYPSIERYIYRPVRGAHCRIKLVGIKYHAGCKLCRGYGYVFVAGSYSMTEECVCVKHDGIYTKRTYRLR